MVKPKYIQPLGKAAKIRLAIVTGSGFGKTVFCGTAPKALFLTTDMEGTVSAKQWGSTAEEWKINSWEDPGGLEEAYQYMLHEGCANYDWLLHDNATEEQNLGMEKAMEVALVKAPSRSPYVPDKREYQISQNGFIAITKKFHALPIHQVWTVHRKWFDPDNGEDGFWSANIQGGQGAIAEQFLGYMNMIGMGEVKENKAKVTVRRLYFDHYKAYRGKDRFQKMGLFQDNLTIPKMMDLIQSAPARRSARRVARKTVA
jgi:hypothetical protein